MVNETRFQGQDGVDLEMNMNGSKSTFELEDDEFEDVVCFLIVFTYHRLFFVKLFASEHLQLYYSRLHQLYEFDIVFCVLLTRSLLCNCKFYWDKLKVFTGMLHFRSISNKVKQKIENTEGKNNNHTIMYSEGCIVLGH